VARFCKYNTGIGLMETDCKDGWMDGTSISTVELLGSTNRELVG
jgi:hypothetical protein